MEEHLPLFRQTQFLRTQPFLPLFQYDAAARAPEGVDTSIRWVLEKSRDPPRRRRDELHGVRERGCPLRHRDLLLTKPQRDLPGGTELAEFGEHQCDDA